MDPNAQNSQIQNQPVQTQIQPQTPNIAQNPNQNMQNQTTTPSSPSKKPFVIIVLTALILILIILGLWALLQNQKTSRNAEKNASSEPTIEEPTPANREEFQQQNLKKYGVVCKGFNSIDEAKKNPDIACAIILSGKNLSSLPDDFSNLNNLTEIDLSNNNFTQIPKELYKATNLLTINLTGNKINNIPADIQTYLPQLESIILDGNPMDEAKIETYKNLPPPNLEPTKTN